MAVHRAEQILDAVTEILTDAGVDGVGKYRVLTYTPDLELPAVSVRMGQDAAPDVSNIPVIDSLLIVSLVAIVAGATEQESVSALMALRAAMHVALMADRTLGLDFVSDTRYAGATAPELETDGERIAARQETQWLVPYRMNLTDPTQ